jgi:peroxiredoxin
MALLLLTAGSLSAALKPGDKAPAFTAQASFQGQSQTASLKGALRKGPVVLYFFPSAFTKGCDLEAHAFADQIDAFTALSATVLGVSADSLERLNAFSKDPDYCAGKFLVATDPAGQVAAAYGLTLKPGHAGAKDVRGVEIGHGFIPRTTFIITRDRRVAAVYSSDADGLTPPQHVERALAALKQLAGKGK